MHTRRGKQANKSCTPQSQSPYQARFPAPSPLSKPTRTACTDAEAPGAGERRQTRPSSSRTRGLVTPVTSTSPPPPASRAGPWGRPLRPAPLLPRGASRSRTASLWAAAGRARPGRAEGGGGGEGGEGEEGRRREKARCVRPRCPEPASSAPSAAPVPTAPAASPPPPRLRRLGPVPTPGLARPLGGPHPPRLPTAPPGSSPAASSLDRPGEGSKRASAPSPQPRAPARAATKDREDERRRQSREGEHPERGQPSGGGGTEGGRLGVSGRTGWGVRQGTRRPAGSGLCPRASACLPLHNFLRTFPRLL